MNFCVKDSACERIDVTVTGGKEGSLHVNDKILSFPPKAWRTLLESNRGDSLQFTVAVCRNGRWTQYRPFSMYVSPYPINYGNCVPQDCSRLRSL